MPFCTEEAGHQRESAPTAEPSPLRLQFLRARPYRHMCFCFACSFSPNLRRSSRPTHRLLPFPNLNGTCSIVCSYPQIPACATSEFFHHVFCEHTAAAKSNSALYQAKDHVLAFLADHRYVFHLDDEFTATKICSGLFAGAF